VARAEASKTNEGQRRQASWALRMVLTFGVLVSLVLFVPRVTLNSLGQWLAMPPQVAHADAIVVLSGGGPERLMHGITLYKEGLAPRLWYTGDALASGMTTFTDAQLARKFAIEQGVPLEAISLLSTTSTWEDGREIAAKVSRERIQSVLLVTDWYHSQRALCVVRQQLSSTGATLYYSPPPALTYGPGDWWHNEDGLVAVSTELIKFSLYRLKYDLTPWRCDQLAYSSLGVSGGTGGAPLGTQWAVLGVLGCLLTYLGVLCSRRWAEWGQVMDIPNERSSHTRPTPRGGGLPIVVLTLMGLLAWAAYNTGALGISLLIYVACGALIAGVSWIDDLRSLPNRVRFAVHLFCAAVTIWTFGGWSNLTLPLVGQIHLGWVGLIAAFVWIVGMINAYNFMDGIDGLAGSQAVVAGAGWVILGLVTHQPIIVTLGLLLAACSFGFLGHNWPPARIFMGDVGSAFLGYTFAILPLLAYQSDARLAVAGAFLVWPFLFDAIFTFLRRARLRENVFAAHRSHLYQRLVIAGYTHRAVTLLYIALSVTGAVLALAWPIGIAGGDLLIVLLLPVLCVGLWLHVVSQERKQVEKRLTEVRNNAGVL
jgi:Fuc2NAc and GlcNAc transferase